MAEQGEKTEKKPERYKRSAGVPDHSRYSSEKIRSGSRYDPENIKTGSRYDREKAQAEADRKKAGKSAGSARDTGKGKSRSGDAVKSAGRGKAGSGESAKSAGRGKAGSGETRKKEAVVAETRIETIDAAGNIEKPAYEPAAFRERLMARDPMVLGMLVLLLLLIAVYLSVAVFFAKHFYPGTTILGVNCASRDSAWVKNELQERVKAYTVTLKERYGVSEFLSAESIGMRYADDGTVDRQLEKQLPVFWPVMMFVHRGTAAEVPTIYDADKVGPALRELGCFQEEHIIQPRDACLEETDEGYVIVPEEMGTKLDPAKTEAAVKKALDTGEREVFLEFDECYVNPEVYADDPALLAQEQAKNALLGADLTYDFVDRSEHLDTRKIMEFIVPDGEGGFKISEDEVLHYANVLADTYDTYGGTRTFHTSCGTVETLYGGDYGWAMDRDATGRALLEAIREKRTGLIEPVYMYTARDRSSNDIGSTYVEICIKRQEMWCYKDGELVVDTPVVTGNPGLGNATPSGGVWAIDAKMQDYVLVGEGYRSPVDFWMPFNGNIGIHDMQTRYYFGSTIYLTHGSHGCVNTPLDAVEQIYNTVEIGTPVIVYEGEV